jgi:hypothetical protein
MKIIGQFLLITFIVATLSACNEMGKGPSRPKDSTPSPLSEK